MYINDNFLLVNDKFTCHYCKNNYFLKDYNFKFFVNLFKSNNNLKNEFIKNVSINMNKELTNCSLDIKSYLLNDFKLILNVLELMFKGNFEKAYEDFLSYETSIRDEICQYIIDFTSLKNITIFCSSNCKSKNTREKNYIEKNKSKTKEDFLNRIYEVTDRRLGNLSLEKIINKIKNTDLNNNTYFKDIKFGKKAYHLISKYENGFINVTPYCVWFVSNKGEIFYVYNNINERYKGSLKNILDLSTFFNNSDIFNTAFLLYDCRKNENIFLK